jgi:hypothetical protein
MQKHPIREFEHGGRTFQIGAEPSPTGWKVRLLENGKPVVPVVYSVSNETVAGAAMAEIPINLVEGLISLLRHDVESGILPIPPLPKAA